jgi:hypothetical protein
MLLPVELFAINRANKDGLQAACKSCDNKRQKKRRIEKKKEMKEYSKEYRKRNKDNLDYRLQGLLNASRSRAKEKGREHTLTLQDLKRLFPIDRCCPVFGFKLEWNQAGFRKTSPSLDRIDSTKGYTLDNVQIISWKANRIKSYATVEELEIVIAFMK